MTTLSSTLSTSWRQPDYDALIKTTEEVYNEVDKVSFTFKDVFRRHEQHFRCQLEEPTQRLVKNHVFYLLQAVHQNLYTDKAASHPEDIYNYTPNFDEQQLQPKLHDLLWSTDSLFVRADKSTVTVKDSCTALEAEYDCQLLPENRRLIKKHLPSVKGTIPSTTTKTTAAATIDEDPAAGNIYSHNKQWRTYHK